MIIAPGENGNLIAQSQRKKVFPSMQNGEIHEWLGNIARIKAMTPGRSTKPMAPHMELKIPNRLARNHY